MEPLEQYRTENGLTKTQLADLLGVSPSMISLVLSGARKPGFALAQHIERVTGIPKQTLRPDVYGEAAQ
jgi:transcriptional regulator with XRE-family HTH domain